MSTLHCPVCDHTEEPKATVGVIAICGFCGASVVTESDGTVRRAMAADTDALMPSDRARLVKARSALARPERAR
jgi:hypothetical protein